MMSATATSVLIRRDESPDRPASAMEHGQRRLLLVLLILTSVAWLLTVAHGQSMSMPTSIVTHEGASHHVADLGMTDAAHLAASGMAGVGLSFPGLLAFVVAWAVMMAAMMFPGLAPMLLTVHAIARHRRGARGAVPPTAVFVSGYLIVWTAVGCLTWGLVQALSHVSSRMDLMVQTLWSPLVLGGALVVAGLYQFTPFKQMCLDHCRSPFIVVMQRWREGYDGALRMGLGHGLYCLGCCWALFTVLVAAGIMSLAWMLALTLIDVAEKSLPSGRRVGKTIGVVLLVLGIAVVTRMLSLPGSA